MAHQPQPPDAPLTWIERGIYLAIVLACAVALSPNLADADLWGHVQYGRDALQDGLPATTTYSYTAEGYGWVNRENLAELILAAVAATAGGPGLLVMKCALGLLVIAIMMRRARRQQASMLAVCVVALLVSVNMTYHWSVRPQVFSYTLFAVLMAVVSWCFEIWPNDWRDWWLPVLPGPARTATDQPIIADSVSRLRYLWFVPAILFVGANTHGGFVAGFCILACVLFCRSIQSLLCWGKRGWPVAGQLMMIIVATGLATAINPYSIGLHGWLWQSLGQPRPEIAEWHPPDLTSLLTIPLIMLTALWVIALLASRCALDWCHLVVMSVTLWQCYEHQRHVPFFAILFGLWMAPHVDSLLRRFQAESDTAFGDDLTPRMRGALAAGLAVALVLLGVRLHDRLHQLRVERDEFPVTAFQYMADQEMEGKLVVTYNWAQYAIAAFCSEQPGGGRMRVGFDGRFRTCYPQEVVDMHFDFVLGNGGPEHRWRGPKSPQFDPSRVLEFKQPDLVLISRLQTHAVQVMEQQQVHWALIYQDELAQLWGRAAHYDDPASEHYLPPARRRVSNEPQLGSVPWPALPQFAVPAFATAGKTSDQG